MTAHLSEKELATVLSRAEDLPSLPAVALEVLRISQDEDASLDEMASCLSRDPALAAKLLKLANSSLFGGGKAVTTLQRATMLLGTKTVKLMALSFSLAGTLPKKGRQGSFEFGVYWHRSLVNAIAARSLARLLKSNQGDEAFLCGLFAHFGKLVLTRCMPEEYEAVLAAHGGWPTIVAERESLGFSSADVCAALLKSWDLPALIHSSLGAWADAASIERLEDAAQKKLAHLLSLAHRAESVLCDQDKGAALTGLHDEMQRLHSIPDNEVNALLVGLEAGIGETADMLAVQLPRGLTHEDILHQARTEMMNVSLGTAVDLAAAERRNRELEGEKRALESRATTDRLTGLPNRAAFDEFLDQAVRARIDGSMPRGLGLLMIDVDNFKKFNDTYGHQTGDEVLRAVGGILYGMTRKGDLVARYGGEEFALVVPETNPFGLKNMADRLRDAIERHLLVVDGKTVSVTASFGGACINHFRAPSEGAALIKLADHYLYQAKKRGRNRCEISPKLELPGNEKT